MQTHTDVIKEVRQQEHNYVCSKERTVVRCAVLTQTEVRAPSTSVLQRVAGAGDIAGCVWHVDCVRKAVWNRWTGLLDWNTGMA